MEKMPDGNTAALRQHEASQAKGEAIHDAYGERVIRDLIDDVIYGRGVKGRDGTLTAADFISGGCGGEQGVEEFIEGDELAVLLCGDEPHKSDMESKLQKRLEGRIRNWLEESSTGTDLVDERCRVWEEDDRSKYRDED